MFAQGDNVALLRQTVPHWDPVFVGKQFNIWISLMKRVVALPVIVLSAILAGCTDVAAPERKAIETAEAAKVSPRAVVSAEVSKSVGISSRDAASRLTYSMGTGDAVSQLRATLNSLGSLAIAGETQGALMAATRASEILTSLDPSGKNPDAAAIRLVLTAATKKLSQ